MDRLQAYYTISKVKPPYYKSRTPYQTAHVRRIQYNLYELELHYNVDLGLYFPQRPRRGGADSDRTSSPKIELLHID